MKHRKGVSVVGVALAILVVVGLVVAIVLTVRNSANKKASTTTQIQPPSPPEGLPGS